MKNIDKILDFDVGDKVEVMPKKNNPRKSFVGEVVDVEYSHDTLYVLDPNRDMNDNIFEVNVNQVNVNQVTVR